MRIAFLSYDFPEYCVHHANAMACSHDVLLMLPHNQIGEAKAIIDPRVNYQPFFRPRYRQPIRQLSSIAQILRTVRSFRPDVVHLQNGHLFFNLFLPLLRKYPLTITIHDPRQHLGDKEALITPQWLMDFGFKRADQAIVHGADLVSTVVKEIGIEADRIHVIPHVAIGAPTQPIQNLETTPNILFFGRIWEYKGLDYLIQAEPLVSKVYPNVKFVIGGKGEGFKRYRDLMVNPDRFDVYNDWISDSDRTHMFQRASVVVLPYVEASQSGVIPIAYNHAKPVIATTVGGLPEMVEHGKTGLLVEPRNSRALADAILELLADEDRRKKMGAAGQEKLRRECDPVAVAEQTIQVYQAAIRFRTMSSAIAEVGN